MRRALRRAAQAFVAAGAIGLVSPAWVQTSHAGDRSVPPHARKVGELSAADLATLDVMQVELAWLANQATFHHTLGATATDGMLEVRGYVPNTAVKELALRIAGQHTSLPIVDHVQINSNMVIPIGGAPVAELTEKATEVLADSMLDAATEFEIGARDNGVVTIKGTVGSVEEKLAISRKMRQVSGCTAVVNQMSVNTVVRAGRRVTPLTADGEEVLTEAEPKRAPVTPARPQRPTPVVTASPVKLTPVPQTPTLVAASLAMPPAPVGPAGSQPLTPSQPPPATVAKPTASPYPSSGKTSPPAPSVIAKPTAGSVDAAKAPEATEKKPTPPAPVIVSAPVDTRVPEIVSVDPSGPRIITMPHAEVGDTAKPIDVPEKKPTPTASLIATAPPDKPAAPVISTNPPAPVVIAKPATASGDVAKAPEKKPTPVAPSSAGWSDKPAAARDVASNSTRVDIAKDGTASGARVDAAKKVEVAATPVEATPRTVVPDKPATPSTSSAPQSTSTAAKPAASVAEAVVHNAPNAPKRPGAHEEKPVPVAYVTTGTVTFDDDLTPPPAPALKPMPAPTPPAPGVKTPVMPPPSSPKLVPVPLATTEPVESQPTPAAWKLRREVEKVCGNQAREVQVVLKADKMMHVKVKVNDQKAGLALTGKILQLPEMSAANVRLELEVVDKK